MNERVKWINNYPSDVIGGLGQIPNTGDLLIITKSLKDVMCLDDLGYNSICPQSESYNFTEKFMKELKDRFKKVIVFYDYDEAGLERASLVSNKFNISKINTGTSKYKDISDYYKQHHKSASKKLMKKLLKGL